MEHARAPGSRGATGVILAAFLVALAAVFLVVFSGERAGAKPPKFKVVTRTFDKPAAIFIRDGTTGIPEEASPYPSAINVSGLTRGRIIDVDVRLRGLIHPAPNNIDAVVFGPGRTGTSRLMSDAGGGLGSPANGVTLLVDDEAPEFMPMGGPLQAKGYKPSNYEEILDPFPQISPNGNRVLSVFDGKNPNGTWRLFVVDDSSDFDPTEGQFAGGWAVKIKAKVKR